MAIKSRRMWAEPGQPTPSGLTGTVVLSGIRQHGHLFIGEDAKIEEYVGGDWTTYMSGFTGTIVCPTFDNSGNLWVGSNTSLYKYVGGAGQPSPADSPARSSVRHSHRRLRPQRSRSRRSQCHDHHRRDGHPRRNRVNSASSGENGLSYTLSATVQSGGATLSFIAPADGTLPGAGRPCTLPATRQTWGSTRSR